MTFNRGTRVLRINAVLNIVMLLSIRMVATMFDNLTNEELADIRKLLHVKIMEQKAGVYTKWNQLALKIDQYLDGRKIDG